MARQRKRSKKPHYRDLSAEAKPGEVVVDSKYYINGTSEVIMQDKHLTGSKGAELSNPKLHASQNSQETITSKSEESPPSLSSLYYKSSDINGTVHSVTEHQGVKNPEGSGDSTNQKLSIISQSKKVDSGRPSQGKMSDLMNSDGDCSKHSQKICDYCALTFSNESDLNVHCQTEAHQIVVMSDGGREWKYRPPPRGIMAVGYTLCENWDKTCRYGSQCVEAHSAEELQEWCERFEYRQKKIQQAEQQNLLGKSYTEHLLEKWSKTSNPDSILKENVDYVEDSVSENQLTTTVSKDSKTDWTFLIKTSKILRAVALLQYPDRNRYSIKCVRSVLDGKPTEWLPQNDKEWLIPESDLKVLHNTQTNVEFKHSVCVEFLSDIYGTFRQTVAFDFGVEPLVVKHLCVDVRPASFASNVEELKKELFLDERWDEKNAEIIKFPTSDEEVDPSSVQAAEELLRLYPTPTPSTFTLTQSTVTERTITKNNYCSRMHELLGVEEMARYQQVAHYNVRSRLNVTKSYLLAPAGIAHSTAKYAQNDEMYAVMHLSQAISEDTAAGRLILNNCTSVLLCAEVDSSKKTKDDNSSEEKGKKRRVFEALIEDKGRNVIYLKLSADTVREYKITGGMVLYAEVQFQLNRVQYCEWHHAVDSIQDYKILFPETFLEPDIPWTPQRQWKEIKEAKLNVKQKEAIVAITTPLDVKLPPVLIIGPFGTGKTYTLAQAIKQLLTVPESRILVCTHSNSAADIYIHDYLHPYVLSGHENARPLRIYYHKRWVSTVHPIVQKYSLIEVVNGTKRFRVPRVEDVQKHRVVVVTLNQSMVLAALGLSKGFFTHILLDEAAQAMECEAIMPLALAGEKTRIVLAGDHMQLNPELFSPFAKERNLHMSLLERLYDHYPSCFPCKILLTENYRAHEAIIKFTSDLFYEQKLVSSGRQPGHPRFHPLTFFSCRGEDVQESNSTGHYNLAEVYEIAERVVELRQCWPPEWGELNDQSIGIMTPYADQVFRIRCELRRKSLGGISVERVLNVQGKQFRAIFISTVRTRRTCSGSSKGEDSEYGFLSNSKLLNTAITRAQSLVAVVGDPIALCSLGRCRKVWEHYIKTCGEHNSLFGMPWSTIQAQLDGVEFMPTYVLNPLAPEFIPMGISRSNCRAHPSVYNPSGNEALLLNGYHSHLTYFDPSQPNQSQPQWCGPGSGPVTPHVGSQTHPNMFHRQYQQPSMPPQPSPHQQHYSGYQVPQVQTQSWSVQPEQQFRAPVVQNQGPSQAQGYLIGTCRLQPSMSSDVLQPHNPAPSAALHLQLATQSQRIWPTAAPHPNTVAHFVPDTVAVQSNAALGGKLALQGVGVDFMGSNVRGCKVNPHMLLNSGLPGFGPNSVPNAAFQPLSGGTVRPVECQPYQSQQVVQPVQQLSHQLSSPTHNQPFYANRQATFQNSLPYLQAQQTLFPQQLQPKLSPQGMQNQVVQQQQAIAGPPFSTVLPFQVSQQSVITNLPLHQIQQQQPQVLQQQVFLQYQQPQIQPFVHEQQLRELENQLWLQQEQQRQQQQQLALLYEQRKFQLGHILTPLVHCKPEWNKLIPKGVNLLDMVDNKLQQEEWFGHLIQHGQEDLARKFAEFMVLCVRTIAAATPEHKPALANPSLHGHKTPAIKNNIGPNLNESIEVATPIVNGRSSSSQPSNSPSRPSSEEGRESTEPVIMMKDLDPTYMLGSDPFLNGGKSVWAIAQDELEHCSRNGLVLKKHSKANQKTSHKTETFDSDDSGDELLSSINRQLDLQQSVDD